jgi:hypothetical protein
MTRATRVIGCACQALLLLGARAGAQPSRDARLIVTVLDQTNAVIPGATVTVTGSEAPTRAAARPAVPTSTQGVATITSLPPGRYDIRAEFAGFEPTVLNDVRLRVGDNRHAVVLRIKRVEDSVTVGQDPQTAASDRRGTAFGSALTREQIDALSDDPEEMRRQLQEMAGPGAVIRVDSFEGSALPPKAMIKSIHVTRDAFAAENHNAGAFFLDIITQPGLGAFRMGLNSRFRSGTMSGRSPFTSVKGPELMQDYGLNVGGPLLAQKSSFNIFVQGMTSYDTPNLNVALLGATRAEALGQRTRRDRFSIAANFDYAVTRDQTLRVFYTPVVARNSNLGIGGYDFPERAYANEDRSHNLRIQQAGPVGRRFFLNTRLGLTWLRSTSQSAVEAPTLRVNDAFTSGGQQLAGGRRQSGGNLSSDLDYVRGIHSVRTGISLDFFSYHSDVTSNYLGTFTFDSLEDYDARRPSNYLRRIGDPTIAYRNVQAGAYVQDDIRVGRNLTLSPGIRFEAQTHVGARANAGPRFGLTWAPFRGAQTTVRGSVGVFYDWLNTTTYEQTLRVDGFRQQELSILHPSFPDPGDGGVVPPVNRYVLGADAAMARNVRVSTGIDQAIRPRVRVGVLYAHVSGTGLLRGLNLNPLVDGVRRDPVFANIIAATTDARSEQHTLTATLNMGAPPPPPFGGAAGPRWDWTRTLVNAFYTVGSLTTNTDGDFTTAPTGDVNDDWGPSATDARHRLFVGVLTQALRNFNVALNLTGTSGLPYTIRTGRDENGDAIFNDRPTGVGRNTERGGAQWSVNANFAYGIAFGKARPVAGPGGVGVFVQGGPGGQAPTVTTFTPPPARFRVLLMANVQNLLNRSNYGGYSGTMTSRFFRQPTMVMNPRKIDFNVGFNF